MQEDQKNKTNLFLFLSHFVSLREMFGFYEQFANLFLLKVSLSGHTHLILTYWGFWPLSSISFC